MGTNLLENLKWQLQYGYESPAFERQVKELFYIMHRYLTIFDWDNGTNHSMVFYALYLIPRTKTYEKIAEENNIHERTLNRYVSKYNDLAKRIIVNKFPTIKERYDVFFRDLQ